MSGELTKECTKCKEIRAFSEYYKCKSTKDGLAYICKPCDKAQGAKWRKENSARDVARKRQYYKNNPDKVKAMIKQWRKNNPDKVKAMRRKWEKNNPDKVNAKNRRWKKANKGKIYALTNKRRAQKLQAAIKITKEEKKQIEQIYARCERLNKTTNIKWEVDHIAPLQGVSICGLHVPWNLQVIPAEENRRKNNKFESYIK